LAELFSAAMAQHRAGATADAEQRYRHILSLFPDHAETHGMLAVALITQGKTAEAIPHFERTAALRPEQPGAHDDLGKAYLVAGKPDLAVRAAARALELEETERRRMFFAHCAKDVVFSTEDVRMRGLMLRALVEGWDRPRDLSNACISLIKHNPAVTAAIACADAAWPARLTADQLGAGTIAALAQDQLLCRLLECDPVTDLGVERLLTNIRCAMLAAAADGDCDESLLAFYCAVARQCFINDYVFETTETEIGRVESLRTSFDGALSAGQPYPLLWPVVIAAYFPLHGIGRPELLLERSWPRPVEDLIAQQVKQPAQERELAATMPVLTGIDDEVSRAVRRQYEESPYPRWSKAGPPKQLGVPDGRQSLKPVDILIAGCGTGLSTVELARQASQARILAIDLSIASLSYAKRMAQSLGVTNVEFAQADIRELGSIGREFDFIDASGVLHHLADPWQGWRVLLSLLRPGGAMQIGLYSRLARRNIVAARAYIAERGYQPVAEDIRRCRQEIIASDDSLLKSVPRWTDFFATNECRDLLFHVQEHQMTIPEIKFFIGENYLEFSGFIVPPATLKKFAERYPNRADFTELDCWHAFETDMPDAFSAMYLFSVRKLAAVW
jgi:2-polyprenyl-3-methyl-5-hydroxy-6-metoxy-1,4-benzoquinol methylase